jgi:hypothetical protein
MLLSPFITQSTHIFRASSAASMPSSCRRLLATAGIVKYNAKEKVKVLDLEKIKIQKLRFLKMKVKGIEV